MPDGQINGPIDLPVQPLGEKYSASQFARNRFIDLRVPPRSEGRFAVVTNVGCGMRWTQQCQACESVRTNDATADGEVVWS
jgi:hypothetical protein